MTYETLWELTSTEKDVLILIASGMTNSEIAAARGTTIHAVSDMSSVIFDKLRVENRVQAARWAWGTGLVTVEEACAAAGIKPKLTARERKFHFDERVLIVAFAPQTSEDAMILAQMYFEWAALLALKEAQRNG